MGRDDYPGMSDEEVLGRFVAGDKRAFETLDPADLIDPIAEFDWPRLI